MAFMLPFIMMDGSTWLLLFGLTLLAFPLSKGIPPLPMGISTCVTNPPPPPLVVLLPLPMPLPFPSVMEVVKLSTSDPTENGSTPPLPLPLLVSDWGC